MAAAAITHDHLVRRAERWLLKSIGCPFVLADHLPSLHGEMPDALGFRPLAQQTVLIECKTSRSDFLADRHKPWRGSPSAGMGSWRYFLCPPEVIRPEDLAPDWRLLWCEPHRIRRIHDPDRPTVRPDFPDRDTAAERCLLEDALSYLQKQIGPFSELANPAVPTPNETEAERSDS